MLINSTSLRKGRSPSGLSTSNSRFTAIFILSGPGRTPLYTLPKPPLPRTFCSLKLLVAIWSSRHENRFICPNSSLWSFWPGIVEHVHLVSVKISWVSSFRMLIYLAVSISENVFHFEKWKLPLWSLSSDKHSYPLMLLDKPETSMKISGRYRILCHHKTTRAPMTKRVIAPAMLPRTTFSLEFFDPPGCIMIKYLAWEKCTYNLPQNLVFSRDCQFVIKVPVLVLPPSHENKCWSQFKWLPV